MLKITKWKEDLPLVCFVVVVWLLLMAIFYELGYGYELNKEPNYNSYQDRYRADDMQYQMDKIRLDQERMRLQQEMDRLREQNHWDYN